MKPAKLFQHKKLVAFYRLDTFSAGKVVTLATNLSWAQALFVQEKVPCASIRFSHHEEMLFPQAVNSVEVQS